MKIYTKTGDKGQTALVDGSPISKSHGRIKTYGTVDELNSHLGLLISMLDSEAKLSGEIPQLKEIQVWLFQLGSQLACANDDMAKKLPTINENQIQKMEARMDQWDSELPALKNFILPGGHPASAQAHVCRTVSRRAERTCVTLDETEPLTLPAISFLNRLSDYFFVFARLINHRLEFPSVEWKT